MNDKEITSLKTVAEVAKTLPNSWIEHNMDTSLEEYDGVALVFNEKVKKGDCKTCYKY